MPTIETCTNCGIKPEKLRTCTRCGCAAYCNKECQRMHWKHHKSYCKSPAMAAFNAAMTPDPNRPANNVRAGRTKEEEEESKALREAKKRGSPVVGVSMTSQGLVLPNQPLPPGLPANFRLKQYAHSSFLTGSRDLNLKGNEKLGNLKYEKDYKNYYDDLVESEETWMTFFDHPANYEHAEHSCGILGSLATVYRQRGNYNDCEEVLNMEAKVLRRYKEAIKGMPHIQIECYDSLEYKYNMIRFNVDFLGRKSMKDAAVYFRKLLLYEVEKNLSFEHQNFLYTLNMIGVQPTPRNVRNLSNVQLCQLLKQFSMLNETEEGQASQDKEASRVALMTCARCNLKESTLRQFKECSRCKKVFYCGKACQKKHWKTHKKVCNKKKST